MTLTDAISTLQRLLGLPQDGIIDPILMHHAIAAVRERDALRARLNAEATTSPPSKGTLSLSGRRSGPEGIK